MVGSLFGDRGFLQLVPQQQRAEALAREIEELPRREPRGWPPRSPRSAPTRAPSSASRARSSASSRPGETVFLIRDETPPVAR